MKYGFGRFSRAFSLLNVSVSHCARTVILMQRFIAVLVPEVAPGVEMVCNMAVAVPYAVQ